MEDPTTKPSCSKPASPSRTYSETDRSEVNTPDGLAPAVCASRPPAACGSHVADPWSCCWLPKIGIIAPCQSSLAQSLVLRGAQRVEARGGTAEDGLLAVGGKRGEEPGASITTGTPGHASGWIAA